MDYFSRVKSLSETKNITLQELIMSVGMNHDTYYSLKRIGKLPRADEALKMAKTLDTTVEYLITGEDPDSCHPYREALKSIQNIVKKSLR